MVNQFIGGLDTLYSFTGSCFLVFSGVIFIRVFLSKWFKAFRNRPFDGERGPGVLWILVFYFNIFFACFLVRFLFYVSGYFHYFLSLVGLCIFIIFFLEVDFQLIWWIIVQYKCKFRHERLKWADFFEFFLFCRLHDFYLVFICCLLYWMIWITFDVSLKTWYNIFFS